LLQFHVFNSGHRLDALSRTWGHYGDLVLPGMCTLGVAMCVFGASLCTTGDVTEKMIVALLDRGLAPFAG
jgi:hypothetical protein